MSQRIVEVSREYDRGKGFLFGLYVGLLLLLILVSLADPFHLDLAANKYTYDKPGLHTATNIYGILALAGAVFGFWRIWKWTDKPRRLLFLPSIWICIGLAVWVVAQGLWVIDALNGNEKYPGVHDIAFIVADLCWLGALWTIFRLVNKLLKRLDEPEIKISPFMAILSSIQSLLVGSFVWLYHPLISTPVTLTKLFTLGTDFIYILSTYIGMILAVALVNGKTSQLPLPVQRCLRYLFAATAINAFATIAFVLTTKAPVNGAWKYADGNWIDWLLLTAMYCWGISALKCPIREAEYQYTYSTTLSNVKVEDFYRAREITQHYLQNETNSERTIYLDSTRWIRDNISKCWNIVKLGDLVVGSTLVLPVSQALIKRFRDREITEREMFKEVQNSPLSWECLYLADASILVQHRRRQLAFNCFKETIDGVKADHRTLEIEVHCLPNTLARKALVKKLEAHFGKKVVNIIPGPVDDGIGGRL